jgi:hypothetical protein
LCCVLVCSKCRCGWRVMSRLASTTSIPHLIDRSCWDWSTAADTPSHTRLTASSQHTTPDYTTPDYTTPDYTTPLRIIPHTPLRMTSINTGLSCDWLLLTSVCHLSSSVSLSVSLPFHVLLSRLVAARSALTPTSSTSTSEASSASNTSSHSIWVRPRLHPVCSRCSAGSALSVVTCVRGACVFQTSTWICRVITARAITASCGRTCSVTSTSFPATFTSWTATRLI